MITEHPIGRLGATWQAPDRCRFLVWAPKCHKVAVELLQPQPRTCDLQAAPEGYFFGIVDGVTPGSRYRYHLDDLPPRPDPASRFQPDGVHGPSQIVATDTGWDEPGWTGPAIADYILYELHVGTFTREGTFDAVARHLDELADLGITAIELMPVAQFPGQRNWGYDGVYPFAPQNSYGGPDGLRRLVRECHRRGMAVALDVVYNHLGPEGNYFSDFGYYFTDRYRTPWGDALNFDGPHSDHVVRYFVENALHWIRDFHIDMLRLDAVHAIFDESARPFLRGLSLAVHREAERLGRRVYVVAESNKNDTRHVMPAESGGLGLDGLWNEDFHHSLHALLTGERNGYYQDFGSLEHLARAYRDGFALTGQYSAYRGRRQGVSSRGVPADRFLVYAQNHDQVGNRLASQRLSQLVSFDRQKLAAALVLLSPYIPLLFMGEEYGETAPFAYFVDHSDPELNRAVWNGRQAEFARFRWGGVIPDPKAEETFCRTRLDRRLAQQPLHRSLLDFYRRLMQLRKTVAAMALVSKDHCEVWWNERQQVLGCRRWAAGSEVCTIFHFNAQTASIAVPVPAGLWHAILDSAQWSPECASNPVPREFESTGELILELAPSSAIVLQRIVSNPTAGIGES